MYRKTINKAIHTKMVNWLKTITDAQLKKDLRGCILVSGGAIASMLQNQSVNDFDVYITDVDVLKRLMVYYTQPVDLEVLDWRYDKAFVGGYEDVARNVAIRTLREGQLKTFVRNGGHKTTTAIEKGSYSVAFVSANAISLSDSVQIVTRFWGNCDTVHRTFDFIHATNYWTFKDGCVFNKEALESLLTQRLVYQGSLYPLTSIIRAKKFIKRGWNIGASDLLKIMFQIAELDLRDIDTLTEQLIGVDVAYFSALLETLEGVNLKEVSNEFICQMIDKSFETTFGFNDEA